MLPAEPRAPEARAALVRLVRDESARVLATLIRLTGSVQLAEDAIQDATLRALETWPRQGVPDQPRAWLTVAARRRAIDVLRREAARAGKEAEAMDLVSLDGDELPEPAHVRDDLLRLLFTCCHPALDPQTQIALSLRWLCGLSTPEVARALLVTEPAMAKRLTRARRKISVARIPYRVPSAEELPGRLAGVLRAVYLLFNEGYSTTAGSQPIRDDLVGEAMRLARLLRELLPDDAGVAGLLALLLLQSARQPARFDDLGDPVLLPDQDRTLWARSPIAEGIALVAEGLSRTPLHPDRYVVQAAIAACHVLSPSWESTDWAAIVSWYDVLVSIDPSPVVALNRAVAVGELAGPAAGLAAMHLITLEGYALLPAARGELLSRLGRQSEAADQLREALRLPLNNSVRRRLEKRLAELAGAPACSAD